LMSDISGRLEQLETVAASLDPNLTKSVKRTRASISRAISRFSARYGRSLLERDRIASDRVQRLQRALYPEGIPQERFYSLAYFVARYGAADFKKKVFAHLDPFAADVRDFQP
ncbi:MAG TPA: bacillithiol biosynthesis BshC, partial [Myxococcaceae bacterium]|nr:bacillithiol biosynthesis BshC [Myxococcaceae bacterium]